MKIEKKQKTHFKECENTTIPKILLNICDVVSYGRTDSNEFYRNWYTKPQKSFNILNNEGLIKLGYYWFDYELSYHIIANLVCVELPKTTYNIIPFKYKPFRTALYGVKKFIKENQIQEIHTPIFGTKIIEGDWIKILKIIKEVFEDSEDLVINIYE